MVVIVLCVLLAQPVTHILKRLGKGSALQHYCRHAKKTYTDHLRNNNQVNTWHTMGNTTMSMAVKHTVMRFVQWKPQLLSSLHTSLPVLQWPHSARMKCAEPCDQRWYRETQNKIPSKVQRRLHVESWGLPSNSRKNNFLLLDIAKMVILIKNILRQLSAVIEVHDVKLCSQENSLRISRQ